MKETFQISKRVYRLGISMMFGIFFHYLYVVTESNYFTLSSFVPCIIFVYLMMDLYERKTYQEPIDTMLKKSEQRTEAFNITDFIQGDTGNKMMEGLKMFDQLSKSEYYKKFQQASSIFVSRYFFMLTFWYFSLNFKRSLPTV